MDHDALIREFFVYLVCCNDCGYRIKGGRPLILLIESFFKVCEKIESKPNWFNKKANKLEIYEQLLIKHSDNLKPFIASGVVANYRIDKNYINMNL